MTEDFDGKSRRIGEAMKLAEHARGGRLAGTLHVQVRIRLFGLDCDRYKGT